MENFALIFYKENFVLTFTVFRNLQKKYDQVNSKKYQETSWGSLLEIVSVFAYTLIRKMTTSEIHFFCKWIFSDINLILSSAVIKRLIIEKSIRDICCHLVYKIILIRVSSVSYLPHFWNMEIALYMPLRFLKKRQTIETII